MHMIIVGCGRVGSSLARQLTAEGHDVVIIDRNASAFRRLGDDYAGRTLTGIGFDRDLLIEAGITKDSAVMAVTSGDNSNILIARVAREMFGVEHVVARIYDPRRAAIYERVGIATVATVAWTSKRILRTILPQQGAVDWTDPSSHYHLAERRIPAARAGHSVESTGANIVLINRNGAAQLPTPSTVLQDSDVVHVLGTSAELEEFDRHLAAKQGDH
jgi:trk system potassium uptake protein TrkA